ncbi:predicted protein [Scheffersomyces stipitis CBS 6054]|uniref:J domain-containing protein n=1 Tax=Scheffersomyces stipitis (strain ATCC 58785 / CBS 6054 / NBRC 10063 / NRRL Y-11545) TaxID=322104 RepID=A3M0I5_PICST|nr:predicted protein [Scheffersomyces stipitis CBS 6054]ABN68534.2 predicted protein [Scheffersomyces stipitis CBS 6054]
MSDIDRLLSVEESSLVKDQEIERVLSCSEWDYFAILDVDPSKHEPEAIPNVVKKIYRKKSLLIHPDRTNNSKAPEAFDKLKKAELVLGTSLDGESDNNLVAEKRRLMDIYIDVQKKSQQQELTEVRLEVASILKEEVNNENIDKLYKQRQEASKQAELQRAQESRKMRKKLEEKWEDDRDARVSNWRKYTRKVEKSKKKIKKKLLA